MRTALYRHFNAKGQLLYVGISIEPLKRTMAHRHSSWLYEIEKITFEWFDTREEAALAEANAVCEEGPVHNSMYATSETGRPIRDLINSWPTRKMLAEEIGANVQSVHKWAKTDRIPSDWQLAVLEAAQKRGFKHVTAEWLLNAHARASQ